MLTGRGHPLGSALRTDPDGAHAKRLLGVIAAVYLAVLVVLSASLFRALVRQGALQDCFFSGRLTCTAEATAPLGVSPSGGRYAPAFHWPPVLNR